MNWQRISFVDSIAHAVHGELAAALVGDMAARGHAVKDYVTEYGLEHALALGGNPKPITEWRLDLGGGCYVDAPEETFSIDGLALSVPCEQHDQVLARIDSPAHAPIRRFASGGWYYKLKFWVHATVLSPAQRDVLLYAMEDRRRLAADRCHAFNEAVKRGLRTGVS